MKQFFKFFVDRPILAHVFTLMVLLVGAMSLPHINKNTFPTVDLGEVLITTRYPGAGPAEVELNVTNKIEEELKGIDGIKRYTSSSLEEISTIHIVLYPERDDLDDIKDKIREAVDKVNDLPVEVDERPAIFEVESETFPVLEIGLSGDVPYRELLKYAKRFEDKLEDVPGVSKLDKFGYYAREIKVDANPAQLSKYQVSLREMAMSIHRHNQRASMGDINLPGSPEKIAVNAQFKHPQEVGDVIVRSNFDGKTIRIKDLSVITDGFEEAESLNHINGKSAVSFLVYKSSEADVLKTVAAINKIRENEEKQLPEGITFSTANNMSDYLKNRLSVMFNNGMMGLVLVLGVLSIFFNWRTAIWVALGIPISVMGVFALMPLFDVNINIISLLALIIIIGIIVDDAIIVAESIAQHRERGADPKTAAIMGISDVFQPVLTTIFTTFIAFAPMFVMPGIMGKFISQIPLVITFALGISLLECTIALPAHLLHGMEHLDEEKEGNFAKKRKAVIRKYKEKYVHYLRKALSARKWIASGFVVLFIGSLIFAGLVMNFVLFSEDAADTFTIQIELPSNALLADTERMAKPIEKMIDEEVKSNELQAYLTRIGMYGDQWDQRFKENYALIVVNLKSVAQRDRGAREMVENLRKRTHDLAGYESIQFSVDAGGPPVGKAITVRIISENDTIRTKVANDVYAFIKSLEGVFDLERDDKPEKNERQLQLNYQQMSRLGISVSDVVETVRTAYTGIEVTDVRYGDEDVAFRLQLNEYRRDNLDTLRNLLIPNQSGRLVKLNDIASLVKAEGASNYFHFDGKRSITLTGDVDKSKNTALNVSKAVSARFNSENNPDARVVIGGEAEETQESVNALLATFISAALGIYFLLMILFNSVLQPFIVMLAIPFGIIGIIYAFALHGTDLGFLSIIGIVGLSGVVVNDSLVMVSHINDLRARYKGDESKALIDIVLEGAGNRFRPIILTSLTTIAGLLPLAYGLGGADPFIAPMALALGYGLFFSTPLTLFFLPCFYMVLNDVRNWLSKFGILKARH
ncbi:MAG: efflux RND transporter permease subunit [bacterium]|nr:efflux RND transporter permease subunit [bacterium]